MPSTSTLLNSSLLLSGTLPWERHPLQRESVQFQPHSLSGWSGFTYCCRTRSWPCVHSWQPFCALPYRKQKIFLLRKFLRRKNFRKPKLAIQKPKAKIHISDLFLFCLLESFYIFARLWNTLTDLTIDEIRIFILY